MAALALIAAGLAVLYGYLSARNLELPIRRWAHRFGQRASAGQGPSGRRGGPADGRSSAPVDRSRPPISSALMHLFAAHHPEPTFVEIGANDGESFDPLAPFIAAGQWRGVMVEPIPHIFERLQRKHGSNPRIGLEAAAIDAGSGFRDIHFVRTGASHPGLPPWRDAIASFDRRHVLAEIASVPDAESMVERVEVECLTFADLCRRHRIEQLDLLLIDAEGADWEILASIDLARYHPRLLVWEHHHLDDDGRRACERKLRNCGYTLVEQGLDTWSVDLRPDDELSVEWRRVLEERG